MNIFVSEKDTDMGKVLKYQKPNPTGEDAYLMPDGTVIFDETKIIRAQRIFKQNYWHPDGRGARRVLEKYRSCPGHTLTGPESITDKTTMYAKILSLEPMSHMPLMPAPNVTDCDVISAALAQTPLTNKDLMDGPHLIVTSYRGGLVYLDNGAIMYRHETSAGGGNGYLSDPVGEEGCYVGKDGEWWKARVVYE